MKIKFAGYSGPLKNLVLSKKKINHALREKIPYLPSLVLNHRQLCDLELLINGSFSPLEGFLNEDDYYSVISRMRLRNGVIWPIPIVLDVDASTDYKVGSEIILCDTYGRTIAIFEVSSKYTVDKKKEAKLVYGTTDKNHFGVDYLLTNLKHYYLGGKVSALSYIERYDFSTFRHTPQELQNWFKTNKWTTVIGFQTRNPLHKVHYALIQHAAKQNNGKVLIHPAVGMTKNGDIDYITRIRCYIAFYNTYVKEFAKLSLLPLAMRMAGPKEAIWHAIVRKNYGCTHFIIGRDHAGPGKNARGVPFYGEYDAQELSNIYASEIGIEIIPFQEMVYVEDRKQYLFKNEVETTHIVKNISGTIFRKMLLENQEIPAWFSFPEVIQELKKSITKQEKRGITIFFTGLPSAGKSTLAILLYYKLLELQSKTVTLLDGDIIRQSISKGLGFSKEDRTENIRRIGFVANEITKHGGIAVCAALAPYRNGREENRKIISHHGTYIEIYVATPLRICKKRDIKMLYKKSALRMIKGLTGIDDPYEPPKKAEVVIDTTTKTPQECVNKILSYLKSENLIKFD